MKIVVQDAVRERFPQYLIGYVLIEGVRVRQNGPGLDEEVKESISTARTRFPDVTALGADFAIQGMRGLYAGCGIDPTRFRPSAEALLRRAVLDGKIYRINTVVDVNNLASMRYAMPMGVYDSDQIDGDVTFRLGEEGETMETMAKGERMQIGGFLVSSSGGRAFGSVISDGPRTKIDRDRTGNVLHLVYAPPICGTERVSEALDFTTSRLIVYNGGRVAERGVLRFGDMPRQ